MNGVWITVREACSLTRVTPATIHRLIRQGKFEVRDMMVIPWMVSRKDVEEYAETRKDQINCDGGQRCQPSGYAITEPGW